MLNVQELERRWLRYKLKSYLPGIALIGITAAVGPFIWWQLTQSTSSVTAKTEQNIQNVMPSTPVNEAVEKPAATKTPAQVSNTGTASMQQSASEPVRPAERSAPVVLQPSMQFIRNMRSEASQATQVRPTPATPSSLPEMTPSPAPSQPVPVVVQPEEPIKPAPAKVVQEETSAPKEISIVTKEARDDLRDVINRFNKNPNPALSLFAAKKYYQMGNYEEAYNFALKTNELNPKIDESWIIFCKSLVKLGKKEMAIKTLQTYINHSRSVDAQMLLNDIRKGSFQ